MRRFVLFTLVLAVVSAGLGGEQPQRTVLLKIQRKPADSMKEAGMATAEERRIPFTQSGCDGRVDLRELNYSLDIRKVKDGIAIYMNGEASIEKFAKGALAAPSLIVEAKSDSNARTLSFALEGAMTSSSWEGGGTFRETFSSEDLLDGQYWRSVELRCPASSPYRPASIPKNVTYKNARDTDVAAAITTLTAALNGGRGFATTALYDDLMVLLGPELYARIRTDSALDIIESPKVITVDPDSGAKRDELRIKGQREADTLGAVLRRYLGDSQPRIRGASSRELSEHWRNIGWDIEEPLLVLDYGAHRLILDYTNGKVLMLDELKPVDR
jgi:hypothetical protein